MVTTHLAESSKPLLVDLGVVDTQGYGTLIPKDLVQAVQPASLMAETISRHLPSMLRI
jgi:hypothetical protein